MVCCRYEVASKAASSSPASAPPLLGAALELAAGRAAARHPDPAVKSEAAAHLEASLDLVKLHGDPAAHDARSLLAQLRDAFVFLRSTTRSLQCSALLSPPAKAGPNWASFGFRRCHFDDLALKYAGGGSERLNELAVKARATGDTHEIGGIAEEIGRIVAEAEAGVADEGPGEAAARFEFIEGVLCLVEVLEMLGDARGAVAHLRRGVMVCKDVVRTLRRGGDLVWVQFLSELLARMGAMWGALGDKRRAEGYVAAAGECLGMAMEEAKEESVVLGQVVEDGDEDEVSAPFVAGERTNNRPRTGVAGDL
jgi:hypothetical protein